MTDSHTPLGSDVALMAHAAYAAELVSKLCAPRQPETRVYDWLIAFLGHLEVAGASAERLRVFELGLLAGVGLAPVIDSCAICAGARYAGRPAADVAFRWDPDRGGPFASPARAADGQWVPRSAPRSWRWRRRRSPPRRAARCLPT